MARGFTLVEMIVVVAIVIVVLGLVVPAASSMWAERKNAESINLVQGLLMNARARALQAGGVETGFFAFLDEDGGQRVVSITQLSECVAVDSMENVFIITAEPDRLMPVPMRLVPRYIVDVRSGKLGAKEGYEFFDKDELANEDFGVVPSVGNQAQRHRNFFTMIFSRDGRLRVNRNVLIRDVDENGDGLGDRTGLSVGPGDLTVKIDAAAKLEERCRLDRNPKATTDRFYLLDDTEGSDKDDLSAARDAVGFLIVDASDVALNFPSVDGTMVYDQSVFVDGGTPAEKREMLLRTAQPLYINRFTGMVVRGPVGENEAP